MVPGCDACKYDKNQKQVKLSALVNFVSCHSEKARTPQCHSFKLFHMALFFIFDLPSGRLTRLGLFLEGLWLQVAVASSFVTTHQARRHGVFEGGHEKSPPQNRRNPLETWDGWRSSWDPDVFLQRAQKVGELQSICLNISTIIDSVYIYICNIFKPNSLYIRILIVMHTCIHTYLPTYITLHHITFHYRYRYIYIYIQLFLHSSPMENSLVLCWGSGLQWGDLQGFRARQNLALVAPRKSTSLGFLRRVAVEGRWMTLGRCDGKKVKVGWKIVSTFQKHLCEKRMDWKYMSGNGTKLWDVKLLKTSNVDEIQYSKEKQQ